MAIVQISQIQVRRGLQQDLPNLAAGEFGWSTDTRRLYIGNGVKEAPDYAPELGRTEILTQYSDFLATIPNYTFAGTTNSGYTSQTGASVLTPVTRTLQSVLDDIVNVRDFGTIGNGAQDEFDALDRAIRQIYASTLNDVENSRVQRTIKIPAGTYLISSPLIVPPNCTLVGDGKNNTIIVATTGAVLLTGDALFQTGASIGNLDAVKPKNIFISGIQFKTLAGSSSVVQIDSADNVVFDQVYFSAPTSVTNLVSTAGTTATTKAVTFNGCVFDGGVNGFNSTGTTVGVRITNSTFINNLTNGINISTHVTGVVSENNYFDVETNINGLTGNNYSYGDVVAGATADGGIYSGAAKHGTGQTVALAIGSNDIRTLANGTGMIDYTITNSSGKFRFGTLTYSNSNGVTVFTDEYTEPTASIGANLFASSDGSLSCTIASTATLRYDIKQFI